MELLNSPISTKKNLQYLPNCISTLTTYYYKINLEIAR